MLLSSDEAAWWPVGAPSSSRPPRVRAQWSVIVPFFNEASYLPAMLRSLAGQTEALRLVLVDNGSTDGSGAIAVGECRRLGLHHRLVQEPTAGKVPALHAGLATVDTPFVATCDADTWYPAHYLAAARRLLAEPGCVVAGAFYVPAQARERDVEAQGRKIMLRSSLLPRQCHTGGAGQAFRTAALRAIGGFDPHRWNYVLEDHEIVHRAMRSGSMRYSRQLWCMPSPRVRDRDPIRWTLAERLLYSLAAPLAGEWFFYRFLASRLRSRRLTSERIRERDHSAERNTGETTYSVC